jgi:hypothetical protein
MDEERRISTTVAAEIAGYSAKQLLRYAKRGQVPGAYQLVPGGAWRFNERRLRNWLRQREAECQRNQAGKISFSVGGFGTPELRSADATLDEAYERLFSPKPRRGVQKC